MKKISFLIVVLICSLHSMSQQLVFNEVVSINLPSGAVKLNKDQITAFVKGNGFSMPLTPIVPRDIDYIYNINNMLLELYDGKGDFKDRDLNADKASSYELHKHTHTLSGYTASITTTGNYTVLVQKELQYGGSITYFFLSMNNAKTYALNGSIECHKADADEAAKLLDEIVKSIKYNK